jgi:pimeloyl-ACP methyl ester carboxylesterase
MPKLTSRDGTTIAYDRKGQGPVLILVLGAMNKRGSGKKLADLLKDRFTVISYDRRGRGDSTDTLPYTIDKEIEDIEALIDSIDGYALLYGHSSGAILALMAAAKLGEKVQGLALYELPYNADPAAQKEAEKYRTELARLLAEDKRDGAFMLFLAMVGVTDKQIAAMQRLPMWKGFTAIAPTLAYDTIELMKAYPFKGIEAINTRALVMFGANSPAFMSETARELTETLPRATLRPLEGQTHDVKAEVLAPVLAEFFAY